MFKKMADKIFRYKLEHPMMVDGEVVGYIEKRYFKSFKKMYKVKLLSQVGNIIYITVQEKVMIEEDIDSRLKLRLVESCDING